MKKSEKETTSNSLQSLIKVCAEKKIDFSITQDGPELVVQYVKDPPCVYIVIPDPNDERIPYYVKKCIEKIRTTP